MKKYIVLIAILFVSLAVKSQDKLFLKNGKIIFCKILKEDNDIVYFEIDKNNKQISTFLNKMEIDSLGYYDSDIESQSLYPSTRFENFESLNISVGQTFAVGDFGSMDLLSDNSGLGGKGVCFTFGYNRFLTIGLGVSAKGFFNWNEFKVSVLGESFIKKGFMPVTVSSSEYFSKGFLIGPIYRIPLICNFSIEAHCLFGIASLTEPEVNISNISNWVKMEKVHSNSWILNLGTGMNYSINETWDLYVVIEYLRSSFKFGDIKLTSNNGSAQTLNRGTQIYTIVNTSFGIYYKF